MKSEMDLAARYVFDTPIQAECTSITNLTQIPNLSNKPPVAIESSFRRYDVDEDSSNQTYIPICNPDFDYPEVSSLTRKSESVSFDTASYYTTFPKISVEQRLNTIASLSTYGVDSRDVLRQAIELMRGSKNTQM